jgi:hypothetical protein
MWKRGTTVSIRPTPPEPPPLALWQGDVLLVAVEATPDDAVPEPRAERVVLAEGEATGHAHAVRERDARTWVHEGQRYLLTKSVTQLVHEEHAPIQVPPGVWRIVLQREYEPAPMDVPAWRRVAD